METIKIKVTEDPNTVEVSYKGETHQGIWSHEGYIEVSESEGNLSILMAAMMAWSGQEEEFEVSPEELEKLSGGYWSKN